MTLIKCVLVKERSESLVRELYMDSKNSRSFSPSSQFLKSLLKFHRIYNGFLFLFKNSDLTWRFFSFLTVLVSVLVGYLQNRAKVLHQRHQSIRHRARPNAQLLVCSCSGLFDRLGGTVLRSLSSWSKLRSRKLLWNVPIQFLAVWRMGRGDHRRFPPYT